jgi:hypothetical protein
MKRNAKESEEEDLCVDDIRGQIAVGNRHGLRGLPEQVTLLQQGVTSSLEQEVTSRSRHSKIASTGLHVLLMPTRYCEMGLLAYSSERSWTSRLPSTSGLLAMIMTGHMVAMRSLMLNSTQGYRGEGTLPHLKNYTDFHLKRCCESVSSLPMLMPLRVRKCHD